MATRKKRAPELVLADACRTGAAEASLEPLISLSEEGNAGAAAMVAQVAAALGRWDDVVTHGPFDDPAPEHRAAFDKAVALAPTLPRFKKKPEELPRHLFALACSFSVDAEIIARWSDDAGWGSFDGALDVAAALVRAGKADRAWKTLERWLPRWSPVDELQVLPVELLVDPRLRALMNPQRCRALLKPLRG